MVAAPRRPASRLARQGHLEHVDGHRGYYKGIEAAPGGGKEAIFSALASTSGRRAEVAPR